jgi:hypothetical protein
MADSRNILSGPSSGMAGTQHGSNAEQQQT